MNDLLALATALRERNFDARVRVLVPEDDKPVVGLSSERMQSEWTRAKAPPGYWGYLTPSVELAAYLIEQYSQAGDELLVDLEEPCLYAWRPDDPSGAEQPLERILVRDNQVRLERGRLEDWTVVRESRCVDNHELLTEVDELRAAWARAGLTEIADELTIHRHLNARNLELEDRLRACADAERGRESAVYGDWLESVGDPRGQLAAVLRAHAEARDEATRSRWQAELERLEQRLRVRLFGPSAPFAELVERRWDGPTLAALVIDHERFRASSAPLLELLDTPPCACLRELELVDVRGYDDLAATPCAPGLRRLRVEARSFALMTDAFVRLEQLSLRVESFALGPARLPALRSLALRSSWERELADLISSFDTPMLEHLELEFTNPWVRLGNLQPLTTEPGFAGLRTLRLAMTDGAQPLGAEFARRVLQLARLERVDLGEAALDPDCRAEFEAHRGRFFELRLP